MPGTFAKLGAARALDDDLVHPDLGDLDDRDRRTRRDRAAELGPSCEPPFCTALQGTGASPFTCRLPRLNSYAARELLTYLPAPVYGSTSVGKRTPAEAIARKGS